MNSDMVIGVDLGGTNVSSGIVDNQGFISHQAKLPISGSNSNQEVINRLVACISKTCLLYTSPSPRD